MNPLIIIPTVNIHTKLIGAFRQLQGVEGIAIIKIGFRTVHNLSVQHVGPHDVDSLGKVNGYHRLCSWPSADVERTCIDRELHIEENVQAITWRTVHDKLNFEVMERIIQIAGHCRRQGSNPGDQQHLN